jgi:ABC-type multidrug transport system ATPase subunit
MKCETGKITGLLGRNGQGKSCLFNIVYGGLQAEEKSVRFDKRPIMHAFKRPDLVLYLPQFDFFPKRLSINRVFDDFNLDYLELEKCFPEFSSKHNLKLRDLSGGQFRFLQTYIILKAKSQFAILDEPFTHLMPLQIEKIKEVILEEKKNKGLLITDHLYKLIIDLSDDLYLLSNGKTHFVKNLTDIEDLGYAIL